MSCTNPMIRTEDFKGNIHILKKQEVEQYELYEKEMYLKKKAILIGSMYKRIDKIPCGKCIGCRLAYSREWANRIMLEMKKYDGDVCWFITLTYDDEHIPHKTMQNQITSEMKQTSTLVKADVQNFMKRLREKYERVYQHKGIRFFLAGEYGETTERPHYHACIFNLPIMDELKLVKKNELGQPIWTSEEIEKIWGKGFIAIAKLCWETAAYTARYIMKKQKGPDASDYYQQKGQLPEFTLMSRKPGIAQDYYLQNMDKIYKNDEIALKNGEKTQKIKPPKYYDKLYDIDHHDEMKIIKLRRKKIQESAEKNKDAKSTMTRAQRRSIEEETNKKRNAKLKREL